MKQNFYKISVIIPVYNKEQYLEQCIDSVILQTYKNIELILVDDASTDESAAICDRYASQDGRIKVIHKENGGPTSACVAGMAAAKGDYYMFIDCDDYVDTQMLQEMSKRLNGSKGEIVCCGHILEKQKSTVKVADSAGPGVYEGERLRREIKDRLLGNEKRLITMSRCMKLCEKSIFEGNEKYYDMSVRLGDDFHLMYPALLNCKRLVMMKDAYFYHYRYVEDSIVHGYDKKAIDSVNAWYRSVKKVVEDKKTADGEKKLAREYCYMLIYVMKNELRNPGKDYVSRIQSIFCEKSVRDRILNTPLSVTERSSQLIYLGMRYPDKLLIKILRFIIRRYDKKGR